MGDRSDNKNVYQWDHVCENLPFLEDYNANVLMIQKVWIYNKLASKIVQYVDNLRIIAFSFKMAW